MKKTCFKCRLVKALSKFDKDAKNVGGHCGTCKICRKKNRQAPEVKAAMTKSRWKWRRSNPREYAAQHALSMAVFRGTLKKQPCEVCGSAKSIHGHHDDYGKPLDVRWLCPKHHKEVHAKK